MPQIPSDQRCGGRLIPLIRGSSRLMVHRCPIDLTLVRSFASIARLCTSSLVYDTRWLCQNIHDGTGYWVKAERKVFFSKVEEDMRRAELKLLFSSVLS